MCRRKTDRKNNCIFTFIFSNIKISQYTPVKEHFNEGENALAQKYAQRTTQIQNQIDDARLGRLTYFRVFHSLQIDIVHYLCTNTILSIDSIKQVQKLIFQWDSSRITTIY